MNQQLNWRYATKKFDPSRKVSQSDLNELLEVLRLSPSSYGLQPWKFVIVENPALRAEIKANGWGQAQYTDASHLILLCSLKNMDAKYIKNFISSIAKTRSMPVDSLAPYEQLMESSLLGRSNEDLSSWMKKQVYLALGMLMSACAQKGIDSCPMEGFDAAKVNEILKLDEQGIEAVVFCPIGYRATDDNYASLPKVRFHLDEILIRK